MLGTGGSKKALKRALAARDAITRRTVNLSPLSCAALRPKLTVVWK